MKHDAFGQLHMEEDELVEFVHINPDMDLNLVVIDNPEKFNTAVKELYADYPLLRKYVEQTGSVNEFDKENQSHMYMPEGYADMDIAKWLLDQCQTQEEMQRVGQELLLYVDRNLLPLLQFLKYMVDIFRKNGIVWGVGRGSSVSSYVLYLIGVHKIDSMYYDLDVTEFLR